MITVISALASLLSFRLRGRASLELELITLRHQVAVLWRLRPGRPWLFRADRLLWVWLYRIWTRALNAMVLVKPATVIHSGTAMPPPTYWFLGRFCFLTTRVLFVTHDVAEAVFLSDRVLIMSPRPGRIEQDVEIDLPRPRTDATRSHPDYLALVEKILGRLIH